MMTRRSKADKKNKQLWKEKGRERDGEGGGRVG